MPVLKCQPCERNQATPEQGLCEHQQQRLIAQLANIVAMASECSHRVQPERHGVTGSTAFGSRPPINLATSDYALTLGYTDCGTYPNGMRYETHRNGLAELHAWERLVREERHLVPPALVPYAGSSFAEIVAVGTFLTTHAAWAATQPWADELALEVESIHRAGQIALRAVPARRSAIACPGDDPETGDICAQRIVLPDDFADYVTQAGEHAPKRTLYCRNCTTTWTFSRLLRVAMSVDPNAVVRGFGKHFIEHHLGVSRRHVNRMLKERSA